MTYTADTWPIGAALLQFPGRLPDGTDLTTAAPENWRPTLREVELAGFEHVDLTDSWVRPGDLSSAGRRDLVQVASSVGLSVSNIAVTRRSVIDPDPRLAAENLAYTLRTVEAAGEMGVPMVCVGLHRPLTSAQRDAVWFWLADGAEDPHDDPETWERAVGAFRQVGQLAERVGVSVSLEMYEGTYLGSAASSVRLVDEIGLANVGLNPDIGNLVRLHRPVQAWQEMLAAMLPRTNYWQVKNYLRDHDPATGAWFSSPAPLETGFVDYRTAVGMALDAGFQGPICVEHYGGDGLSVAASNREYLRRILATKLEA